MAFVTALLLIDAPASALNNSGEPIFNARTDNTSAVKYIYTKHGEYYPYVSAQAVRYWLRDTLEREPIEWVSSPVVREDKIAYTDANPLKHWDDDLLGYMRAPSKKSRKDLAAEIEAGRITPMEEDDKGNPRAVTRVSPLRVSTFVSLGPVSIQTDYGTMTRQEGDPVPYEHQFYRTTLKGLISLDLGMAGKFYYSRRTGFQNLDSVRRQLAEAQGLEHLEEERAYRFSREERIKRVQSLLHGFGQLQGGAKQAIHYTDVSPAVAIMAVTEGGNHPFSYLFREKSGSPQFQAEVWTNTLNGAQTQLLSPVFVGWKPGYLPEEQEAAMQTAVEGITIEHHAPRATFEKLATWIGDNADAWDRP